MNTWYVFDKGWHPSVRTIEVEKETAKCVWANVYGYGVSRNSKVSEYYEFFDSAEEMQQRISEYAEKKISNANDKISRAEALMAQASKLGGEV